MTKKIVVEVQMNCQKCRTKAFKIAAGADGVDFVGLEGGETDRIVIIGDGLDPVTLTSILRKKVGYADIITVEEVKPK